MSRDIKGKLARGEKLDEADVQYALDRLIEIPEEYLPKKKRHEPEEAQVEEPQPEPQQENEPADEEADEEEEGLDLEAMTKAELVAYGDTVGIALTMSMTKDQMIEDLTDEGEDEDD